MVGPAARREHHSLLHTAALLDVIIVLPGPVIYQQQRLALPIADTTLTNLPDCRFFACSKLDSGIF